MNVPVKIQENLDTFREFLQKVISNVENLDAAYPVDPSVIFIATVKLFGGFEMMWDSQRRINVPPPEDDANLLTFITCPDKIVPQHINRDELASILRYIDGPYLESFTAVLKEKATTKEVGKSIRKQLTDYGTKFFSSALAFGNASGYYVPNLSFSSDQVELYSSSDSDATYPGLGFHLAGEDVDEVEGEEVFEEEDEDEKEPVVGVKEELKSVEVGVKEELKSVEVKEEPLGVKEEPLEVKAEPFGVKEEPLEVKEEPLEVKEANRKRRASSSPTSSLGSST